MQYTMSSTVTGTAVNQEGFIVLINLKMYNLQGKHTAVTSVILSTTPEAPLLHTFSIVRWSAYMINLISETSD